ncbi:Iota toxin protein Ib [Bacillus thuringiensis]|uniref:Iota toxin protein Ib n=1 Tax=Bacillus thuringiensis TaxID=1428 RepID=A0A9X7GGV9_BACTU|nr:binary toxin-like calcium binding domain-containing protein [Bacillus thuringiensis]PGH79631.1 Iota toxin protein Ib [Bacillus thuringiensis]
MKFTNIYKYAAVAALLIPTAGVPTTVSFAENKVESKKEKKSAKEEKQENPNGLVGHYFKDATFTGLSYIQVGEKNTLMKKEKESKEDIPLEKAQSVRWNGTIKPDQTGEYKLFTSASKDIVVQVNGETVLKKDGQENIEQSIKLEKDKSYEIKIEHKIDAANPSAELKLSWSIDNKEKEPIPEKNILSPNFAEKAEADTNPLIPDHSLFNEKQRILFPPKDTDTDKDGIPDGLETDGYTFNGLQIIPWNGLLGELGYKKYVSSPFKLKTAADPYTDFEKVTGHIPEATKYEARDPLVAAAPAVTVNMEKLLMSKNENVSEGTSGTHTVGTSTTTSNGFSLGGNAGRTNSPKGWFAGITGLFSYNNSKSVTRETSDSESWSSTIGINTAEAAFLNANVRYHNNGTAPIYETKPTTNFVMQPSGDSIFTVTSGPNVIGNSVGPGETYPKAGQAPISLNQANPTATVNIVIDAPTLDALQTGTETLDLETTQTDGRYGIIDSNGNLVQNESQKWSPILTDINTASGGLILTDSQANGAILERRVAAKNPNDPNDQTPEITIGEAIEKAFNAKKINGKLYYTNQDGKNVSLDEGSVHLITDESTQEKIENQLENLPLERQHVYNAKWERGMNLELITPDTIYDFENALNLGWSNILPSLDAYTGLGGALTTSGASASKQLDLKPETSYVVKAFVKNPDIVQKNVSLFVGKYSGSNPVPNDAKVTQVIEGSDHNWHEMELYFNTGDEPESYRTLTISAGVGKSIEFDDVSIKELSNPFTEYNFIKNGTFEEGGLYWNVENGASIIGTHNVFLPYANSAINSDLFELGRGYFVGGSGQNSVSKSHPVKISLHKENGTEIDSVVQNSIVPFDGTYPPTYFKLTNISDATKVYLRVSAMEDSSDLGVSNISLRKLIDNRE